MKFGFYFRLACTGIRKNKQLYLPYILTCVGMVMMFYILSYLTWSPILLEMRGGRTMSSVMAFGRVVVAVFALIFLFYTNSFLIRRRNREFGLYNILGMNKRNISRILCWETALVALISLTVGLGLGMLFSKLAELCLIHILNSKVTYSLSIAAHGVGETLAVFLAIFILILLVSLGRIRLSRPLDLLKSESTGEKPPKANWVLAVIGVVLLGVAYYLAVSIKEPITAMSVFFVAVVMVILATYLLFIAGSVALCRLLQKSKRYYYKPNHFVSVSSMVYRMKRNGAGLASICILCTMVLVMLSSTGSLFIGGEGSLREMYPTDFSATLYFDSPSDCTEENLTPVRDIILKVAGGAEKDAYEYTVYETAGLLYGDGTTLLDSDKATTYNYDDLRTFYLLPLSDYNRLTGENVTLEPGQALIYSTGKTYPYDTLTLEGCDLLQVQTVKDFPVSLVSGMVGVTTYYMFLPDFGEVVEKLIHEDFSNGSLKYNVCWYYCFDIDPDQYHPTPEMAATPEEAEYVDELCEANDPDRADFEMEEVCFRELGKLVQEDNHDLYGGYGISILAGNRSDFYSLYGSLFFLGIMLSIVFLFAAVLIIYYKQVSEGYEDQSRFEIMQKVGMTKREIKKSINSQVLVVFFAPLLLAGLHLAFAFPLIYKILQLIGIVNLKLLLWVNVGCFLAFGLFYAIVYKVTSEVYYRLVSQ